MMETDGGDTTKTTTTATTTATTAITTESETTGAPAPFCVDPQPIFMHGSQIPSGFVRCANGVVHRVEAVACAVEGVGTCQWSGECNSESDCIEAPHGTCHDSALLGCVCKYGCGSDADCDQGEICACAGVISEISQCVPAECLDDDGCQSGLCALAVGPGACGSYEGKTACIDASSPCLLHDDCPDPENNPSCGGCWPDAGVWSCGVLESCGVLC